MTTTATGAGQDAPVDGAELERRVRGPYPRGRPPPGRGVAFRGRPRPRGAAGLDPAGLDRIPAEAVASFAGVGHHLDLAAPADGGGRCSISGAAPGPTWLLPRSRSAPRAR